MDDAVCLRLALRGGMENVAAAGDAVRAFLGQNHVGETCAQELLVIVDELASNVVRHGGAPGRPPAFEIALSLRPMRGCALARLVIVDSGIPFDPTTPPAPTQAAALEDFVPGGHGLPIVRALSDRMEYRAAAGRNEVRVEKQVRLASSASE